MNAKTDTDYMPFGKYKGDLMKAIPANYFHYLWTNGMSEDMTGDVAGYIRNNLEALKKDYTDGIWDEPSKPKSAGKGKMTDPEFCPKCGHKLKQVENKDPF